MSNEKLLQSLTDLVERYAKYGSFIEKASEQAEKFSEVVVLRVVEDNQTKMRELEGEVGPLLEQAKTARGDLQTERDKIQADVSDSQLALEELQLRAAIGELDDEAFEEQSSEVKSVVESADATITSLDKDLGELGLLLARWQEVGNAGESEGTTSTATPEGATPEWAEREEVTPEAVVSESEGAPSEVEPEGPVSVGEVELDEPESERVRGLLVVHEGTPQEQSLPMEGERFTVGRGRKNDFQIKDDSKVSRRHTTFLDEEGVFLIRDGVEQASGGWKTSANGTQVNGQLVTEATLVGGEEITIGETHFRFRVLS